MSSSADRRRRASAGAAALLVASAIAAGDPGDPGLPVRVVVGRPPGANPIARVDGARSGRAAKPLPAAPRVLWRARAQGGTDRRVAVDEHGAVVVASSIGQLVQISADGHLDWTTHMGRGAPLTGPAITSDSTRAVVVTGPALVGVRPDGRLRYRRALDVAVDRPAAEPLALDNGSVVISLGRTVLYVDADGSVRSRATSEEPIAALLSRGRAVLLVGERGAVLEWRAGTPPVRLGSLGGRVDSGAALGSPRSLSAVIDGQRLVDLDLANGTRHIRTDATVGLIGPPAILTTGEIRVATSDGLLLGYDVKGTETTRVAIEPGAGGATGSTGGDLPPVFVDTRGNTAFVRPGLDAAVVDPAGNLHAAEGASCTDPVDIAPAGPRRMVIACRSGLVFLVGDAQ